MNLKKALLGLISFSAVSAFSAPKMENIPHGRRLVWDAQRLESDNEVGAGTARGGVYRIDESVLETWTYFNGPVLKLCFPRMQVKRSGKLIAEINHKALIDNNAFQKLYSTSRTFIVNFILSAWRVNGNNREKVEMGKILYYPYEVNKTRRDNIVIDNLSKLEDICLEAYHGPFQLENGTPLFRESSFQSVKFELSYD